MSNPALALPFAINNALVPKEGPKGVNILLDFPNLGSVIDVDLSNLQSSGQISFIQGFYCDNSAGSEPVFLRGGILGQTITVPAGAQMYSPFMLPTPPVFTAQSANTVAAKIIMTNVPLPFGLIPASSGGVVTVTDPALEALIQNIGGAGNALNVNVLTGGGGGGGGVTPAGLIIKDTLTSTGASSSTHATASNVWYITAVSFKLSPNFTSATALCNVFMFESGGGSGVFFAQPAYFAPTVAGVTTGMLDVLTLSFPEPLEGVNLGAQVTVELSNALTAGFMAIEVWGYQGPPS
jgi:hypothetical protein